MCSVLFADLVGFTPLSESRDPEEVRELLGRYFEVSRTVISRYGGVVEKFIGDAVMAVWGTPVAEEGDAERAVRAGLDLVAAVAELGREIHAPGLAVRAGVVTGEVAVTLGATGQGMVAGDAVNTAARVQGVAASGTVWVDEGTWRLARAGIQLESTGTHELKGKAEPVELWRAERVLSGVGGAQRVDGLEAPFVGRDSDLRLVKELFHACMERHSPRLLSVTGAAGVGKSRLGWEFEKYVDGLAVKVAWHRGRCLSYGEGVAFWALVEMVRQRLDIAEDDSPPVLAEKLRDGLARWIPEAADRDYISPRLGQLLGAPTDEPRPHLVRDELFAGWRLFFERLAVQRPVVLLVEDLHHADSGLLDFFEHLLDWARDVPIFVLTLARPELEERRSGWGVGRRTSTTMAIDALDDVAMDAVLDGLVPGMPAAAKQTISRQAEGVPLYAVETVRMLIDHDVVQPVGGSYRLVGGIGELTVPSTLQSLLAARLDALDYDARRLVADAAVLGGTFPRESLVAVTSLDADEVDRVLATLVRAEVLGVRADPLSPQRGQYGFVQTMLRQVAYDTLSRRERKARHLAVAEHLQAGLGDGGEELAEVIAAHLLDAVEAVPDDPDVVELRHRTVGMLTRAAERAERTGAPGGAARSYSAAADLLAASGAEEDEILAADLLQRAGKVLGRMSASTSIGAHARAGEIYRRHGHLREAAGADTQRARALRRAGRLDEARSVIEKAVNALQETPDVLTIEAWRELASVELFSDGDIARADGLLAAAMREGQAHDVPAAVMGELLVSRGITHTFNLRPVEAALYLREAARRAESLQDNEQAGMALLNLADVLIPDDPQAGLEAAHASAAHLRRIGNRYGLKTALTNLVQGLMLVGDWRGAAKVLVDELVDLPHMDDLLFGGVLLHALSGDLDRARELLLASRLDEQSQSDDTADWQSMTNRAMVLAAAAAAEGDYRAALTHAHKAMPRSAGARHDAVRWSWTIAADSALALDDLDAADGLLAWLDEIPAGHVEPVLRADRERVRAVLLSRRGDPSAGEAFDRAVAALRQFGSPYHLAKALLDTSDHVGDSDPDLAAQLATEAAGLAAGLGVQPLVERARQRTGQTVGPESQPAVH